jgi:HEAT repeat protein
VASRDANPELRARALEILVEREGEEARESLRLALMDSEPQVSERARELIEDLHIEL